MTTRYYSKKFKNVSRSQIPYEPPIPLGHEPARDHRGETLPDGSVARPAIGQETTGHFPFGVGVLFPVQRYSYGAVELYVREITDLFLGFRLIVVPAVDQTLVRVQYVGHHAVDVHDIHGRVENARDLFGV